MKQPIFTGSGTALITPFTNDGINLQAMKQLLDFQLENRTDAIIVCGTTGESSTMSYEERRELVDFCVRYIDGRIPVIVGTGSNNTKNSIVLSRDAQKAGADGLLIVTPYYNKATQEGLYRHYDTIANAVDLPIILYNVPSRTGVTIYPETYARLSVHPNIIGVKEAGSDPRALQKTRNLCPEDFYIWSGNDDETASICLMGGVGVISVVSNIMPKTMHDLTEFCLTGRYTEAAALQLYLKSLADALFAQVNPIPIKTALNLYGFDVGPLRLPLCEMSREEENLLKNVLSAYQLI